MRRILLLLCLLAVSAPSASGTDPQHGHASPPARIVSAETAPASPDTGAPREPESPRPGAAALSLLGAALLGAAFVETRRHARRSRGAIARR